MSEQPDLWKGAFNYLEDLADAKVDAAEYAMKMRQLHDVMLEEIKNFVEVRQFLVFRILAQLHSGRITRQHRDLATGLLPKAPRRKEGRPKGALGQKAYERRYDLHVVWVCHKALNPGLTKEQFAKDRAGVTDEDLNGDNAYTSRNRVDAILQELKPARMKQLDHDQRRAIEIICPIIMTYPKYLAERWREAKQQSPQLTKEDFLIEFFGWPRNRQRHPMELEAIVEHLRKLEDGERLVLQSDRG